jgi:GT2 family glycosyltransferase
VIRHSVIIPTYGRPDTLRLCLEACAALDYDVNAFEVVVVDDGNHEDTRQVVNEFGRHLRVFYIAQVMRSGAASARNAGAAEAQGTYVNFVDDDCAPEPGWLRGLDDAFEREGGTVAVGGRTLNSFGENIYAIASQNVVDFLYEWYNPDPKAGGFFATNNFSCPRDAFWQIGGFDESFPRAAAEDRDFCDRWQEHGWRLVYAPNAVVRHRHRLTFTSFLHQHYGYGRGAVFLHKAREQRGLTRPRLAPMPFYWRLVTYPVDKGFGSRTPALVALGFLSQAVYALGYYRERWRQRRAPRVRPAVGNASALRAEDSLARARSK